MSMSPAAKAAISEGLRRYYLTHGHGAGSGASALQGAARRHAEGRAQERMALRGSGERRARVTRTDRTVGKLGQLAALRQQRVQANEARNAELLRRHSPPPPPAAEERPRREPQPAGGGQRPAESHPSSGSGSGGRSALRPTGPPDQRQARTQQLHADLQTEEGRRRLANNGLLQRTAGGWEPTDRGRQLLGATPAAASARRQTAGGAPTGHTGTDRAWHLEHVRRIRAAGTDAQARQAFRRVQPQHRQAVLDRLTAAERERLDRPTPTRRAATRRAPASTGGH